MANKMGQISTIRKDSGNSTIQTLSGSLAKAGLSRMPKTKVFKFPYKEITGKYRTGLDPDAAYIQRISDDTEREIEIARVTQLREELEKALGVDLSPQSSFWNHKLSQGAEDTQRASYVHLVDGDNYFNLDVPSQALAFAWLRVHPTIASSYHAWERGDYPSDTQFYVVNNEVETSILYKKKSLINKAIVKFEDMSPEKRKKVARQLGLPVTDNTKEEEVYTLVDNILKQTEFKKGTYAGLDPVKVFTQFANMDEALLNVQDTIKQAIDHSILKERNGGKLYRGETEISTSVSEYVKYLMNDDNQEDLILLNKDLKAKKLAAL